MTQGMAADYRDIDGRAVASTMLSQVAQDVSALNSSGWAPRLVSIRIGDHPAVNLYIRNQERAANQVGIDFERRNFPTDISEKDVRAAIAQLNFDQDVTGIILQRPVPKHLPIQQLQSSIAPLKDVEGMHPASIGNIVYRNIELGPCTAMAAAEMLKPGSVVVDIGINQIESDEGHSRVVGDCDYDACREVAGWITPVPGGVGPVTVAVLMRNTVVAARRLKASRSDQFKNQQ